MIQGSRQSAIEWRASSTADRIRICCVAEKSSHGMARPTSRLPPVNAYANKLLCVLHGCDRDDDAGHGDVEDADQYEANIVNTPPCLVFIPWLII